MMSVSFACRVFLLTAVVATLGACGGGGGGGGSAASPPAGVAPPPPPPPPPSGWVSGVFQPASTFITRCQTPRVGFDAEGRRFPDIQGTLLDEKNWLRSWTNETYLWNTEVVDRDPSSIGPKLEYFAQLRTFARTPSGKEKDDFHFSEPTADFLARSLNAATASYGFRLTGISTRPPRDYRVLYTEPGSPAAALEGGSPRFVRGTRILRVNGLDVVNGGATQAELDQISAGLFPSAAGQVTTFVVRDPGATSDRTVTITSAAISSKPVNRTAVISTPTGPVGYILFNTFSPRASEREIFDAMTAMQTAGARDLILDLRYNGGGLLAVASQLGYMVAGPSRTAGRFFERLRFNAAAGNRNPVTGQVNSPTPFESAGVGFTLAAGTPLPTLNLGRVYVLSTDRTCSASEAVINGLRGIGVEVVLIGSTTCGKPFGFYPTDNCGETYYTIQFQGTNDVGFGDYADGFIPNNSSAAFGVRMPGCQVSDDLATELGDPREGLLKAALDFRSTGVCPTPPATAVAQSQSASSEAEILPPGLALELPPEPVMSVNRDMRRPDGSF